MKVAPVFIFLELALLWVGYGGGKIFPFSLAIGVTALYLIGVIVAITAFMPAKSRDEKIIILMAVILFLSFQVALWGTYLFGRGSPPITIAFSTVPTLSRILDSFAVGTTCNFGCKL